MTLAAPTNEPLHTDRATLRSRAPDDAESSDSPKTRTRTRLTGGWTMGRECTHPLTDAAPQTRMSG